MNSCGYWKSPEPLLRLTSWAGMRARSVNGSPRCTSGWAAAASRASDNLARFADALDAAAAQPEVHRGLPFTDRARIPAHEVSRRSGSGDFQYPHEFIPAVQLVVLAVAHVVQRRFRREAQLGPHPVGNQGVQPGAL